MISLLKSTAKIRHFCDVAKFFYDTPLKTATERKRLWRRKEIYDNSRPFTVIHVKENNHEFDESNRLFVSFVFENKTLTIK